MRFKVEQHPEVTRFLGVACSGREIAEYRERLRDVADDPIGNSTAWRDPTLSRFMLRSFRFGACRAIFGLDRSRTVIRVRKCLRLSKPIESGDTVAE